MGKNTRVVIIHGAYGTPNENWLPWLAENLYSHGVEVITPQFPTPEGQSLENWLQTFDRQVGNVEQDMVLVGHSTGAIFILNLLGRVEKSVKSIFLVSGFVKELDIEKFDSLNSSFLKGGLNWSSIQDSTEKAFVYHGDDDPHVQLSQGKELAKRLDTSLNIIQGGGHINSDAGHTEFPLLYKDLKSIIE